MAESWKQVNRFRLMVIVVLSLLTSIESVPVGGFTVRVSIAMGIHAALAGFAFLLCPSLFGQGTSRPP